MKVCFHPHSIHYPFADFYQAYLCANIESDFSITQVHFLDWNSWIGSNCDTGLYENLSNYDSRAVCVGVGTSTTTTSGTPTTTTMGPTQTGTVPGCQKFYTVQSGDTCDSIDTRFGITFSQFLAWNLSGELPILSCLKIRLTTTVGNDCSNLWLGYAYCVEEPPSSTTTVTPPAPPKQVSLRTATNTIQYRAVTLAQRSRLSTVPHLHSCASGIRLLEAIARVFGLDMQFVLESLHEKTSTCRLNYQKTFDR
jgi:hypothetical protein